MTGGVVAKNGLNGKDAPRIYPNINVNIEYTCEDKVNDETERVSLV